MCDFIKRNIFIEKVRLFSYIYIDKNIIIKSYNDYININNHLIDTNFFIKNKENFKIEINYNTVLYND